MMSSSVSESQVNASPLLKQIRLSYVVLCFGVWFMVGLGVFALFRGGQVNYLLFGTDLYPRWIGTRAFWSGTTPYAPEIERESELLIYGRARRPDEVTYLFQYPAHLALVLTPFLVVPLEWVGVIWCAMLASILLTLITVWSWHFTPRLKPLLWGLTLFTGIFFFPAQSSILSGQYPLLILAFALGAIWLLARRCDGWAGIFLAFTTIKPSIGMFIPIVLCLWALYWRRPRVLIGFSVTLALMFFVTFVRIGWWVPDFVQQSLVYDRINRDIDLAWSIAEILTIPGILWLLSSLALVAIGAVTARREPNVPSLALFGMLNLNLLVMPHSLDYDLTMLLVLLMWLGWQWRGQPWGAWVWMLLAWTPWLIWGGLRSIGVPAPVAWKGLWQFYPTFLNTMVLLWWHGQTIERQFASQSLE